MLCNRISKLITTCIYVSELSGLHVLVQLSVRSIARVSVSVLLEVISAHKYMYIGISIDYGAWAQEQKASSEVGNWV